MLPQLFLAAGMAVGQATLAWKEEGKPGCRQAGQFRLRAAAGRNSATVADHFVGTMLHSRSSRHHVQRPSASNFLWRLQHGYLFFFLSFF